MARRNSHRQGSQQRLSETRDAQRKPDIGMLVKDGGGTGKIETQRNVSAPYGVGGTARGRTRKLGGSQSGAWDPR